MASTKFTPAVGGPKIILLDLQSTLSANFRQMGTNPDGGSDQGRRTVQAVSGRLASHGSATRVGSSPVYGAPS